MNNKEMPMTEAVAYISGTMNKAYLIHNASLTLFLLIYIYKSKNTRI